MRIRFKIMLVMTLLVLMTSLIFSIVLYNHKKSALEMGIQQKLFAVTHTARSILPSDFHDRIVDKDSLSKTEYLYIVENYNRLCVTLDLEYVWSLIQIDGKTVFTTGTSTSKDASQGDHAQFFESHSNPELYDQVFSTMKTQYQINDDKWGQVTAALVPFRDSHGRPYLFGASMKTSSVREMLKETLIESILVSLSVLIAGGLLATLLAHSFAKPITELTKATEEIASGNFDKHVNVGGSTELKLLSKNVNVMTNSIRETINDLNDSRENLRTTLYSIGDGVITTDTKGLVTRLNPVAEKLTGWSLIEAKGKPLEEIFNIINADTRRTVENPAARVVKSGEIIELADNTVLISKEGHERHIADSGAPIKNSDGQLTGVVLVFRDVTQQNLMEEQLRQSQKMDSIGQLAGGVAHDFNNMLTGIIGSAELMAYDLEKHKINDRNLQTIFNAAKRAADLTQKLLAFSRKGKIVSTTIDIHSAIQKSVDILGHSIDKNIELSMNLHAPDSQIIGDPSQLESAFLNLGVNARDAMPKGGVLCFSTSNVILDEDFCNRTSFDISPGSYIEVSVSDTGDGIRKEMQKKIFEPFFTTKEVGRGTGLGLAAVYGTVVGHKGMVHLYSEPDEGTIFKLYFPLDDSIHKPQPIIHEKAIHGIGKILVIDDEAIIRNTARQLLGSLGYDVLLAENGLEGVELYRLEHATVDLILMDMVMPKMGGRDTFFQLQKINPDVKIILSSGFSQHASMAELLDNGALGIISKPYRRLELGQAIHNALGTS